MAKICSSADAVKLIADGMSLMIGGFLAVGTPENLIDALVAQGTRGLTVIANDTGFPGKGIGKLQDTKQIAKLYASYIGAHPETGRCMHSGAMEVILTPQGTLAEQIRAGGAGLGGFLTPTGVGTVVAKGKEEITIKGKTYLLELPLSADVALIKAYRADTAGNLIYRRSARNFNPIMAMGAGLVIAEVEEIVAVGTFDPDAVMTPGIFIDYLVKEESQHA
ncbi:CoA transferase subunit A [Candidatus Formimonas warabiya]|uniref:Branched-chain amino acid dehydrogenase n=1 Tax=Formimonas warabiya TaxID=1761012 RepID=A0A3G1KX27_FORW1|nr:CoA transferase subunit A [Candidatus Formimonas warabiya]ATW26919.1 branched-chain amino acid dehydrogenase [Candidatus Formimonas warabiya]